jgi:putative Mn2+ efflux pump MntP
MNLLSSWLLAFSLSLDCFAISISQGLKPNKKKREIAILALLFGLFQGGMLVIGFYAGALILSYLSSLATIIPAILLFFIGIKMIKEGFDDSEEDEVDVSKVKDYIVLSIATSLDAMAAGVSLSSLKVELVITSLIVGLVSLLMGLIGGFSGRSIGEKFGKRSEVFGGLVLLGLGIKVLIS